MAWRAEQRAHWIVYRSAGSSSSDPLLPLSDDHYLRRQRLRRRNVDGMQWMLASKRDLAPGTFLGMYDGTFRATSSASLYAIEITNDVSVFPFDDEAHISYSQRAERPLASMNEPRAGAQANCAIVMVDFAADEVSDVNRIPNYEDAYFFRGLVCVTCSRVRAHDELTWHYGDDYEAHRRREGYVAGTPCVRKLTQADFQTFVPVPAASVFPVFKPTRSDRFGISDSDSSDDAAGYDPTATSRQERADNRDNAKRQRT